MSSTALMLKIGADIKSLQGDLNKATGLMNGFKGQMASIGSTIAGAFAVQKIAAFTFEASKLAGQVEGVKAAFDQLNGSARLLDELRASTKGTVSDFELIKAAVKAKNFNIPLEELGKLLQFAQIKARETGQSVDYMVESLITGIGRQSLPILDNLQISATELREEFARVGDFGKAVGNIVQRGLQGMNTELVTSSMQMDQFKASIENLKVAWGDATNGTGFIGSAVGGLRQLTDLLANTLQGGKVSAYTEEIQLLTNRFEEVKRAYKAAFKSGDMEGAYALEKYLIQYKKLFDEINGVSEKKVQIDTKQISTLQTLQDQLQSLQQTKMQMNVEDEAGIGTINREIEALEKQIEKYKELGLSKQLSRAALSNNPLMTETTSLAGSATDALSISPLPQGYIDSLLTAKLAMENLRFEQQLMAEQGALAWQMQMDKMAEMAELASNVGTLIGEAMGGLIAKEQSFAQALSGITAKLIDMYGKQAILAAISKATQGAPPGPWAIGAAAAAAAAMSALVRKFGASAGGGGGGGYKGMSAEATPRALSAISYAPQNSRVEFKIKGTELVGLLKEQDRRDRRTTTYSGLFNGK